ncbi:hypothetical protein RRG08_029532 [Elysia crispata]|uniref:Fibrinogen C-terminal domain-containing protein n=1 Tax=Elysia crispata TaxID=231223 RepID=A0AAE1CMZ9_9GAST|nr:hypothetical protein RRG08_029532 [Elysia crispata]
MDSSCYSTGLKVRSKLECLSSCSKNTSCENALFVSSSSTCYQNYRCEVDSTCVTFDPSLYSYQREGGSNGASQTTSVPCLNGGQFDQQSGVCDCSNTAGYAGDHCEQFLRSCQDLASSGAAPGVYPVTVDLFGDGTCIFQTHCVLRSWSTSFTILRSSGRVDMGLSWSEYVNGFRFSDEDYWIGLENLHRYTSSGGSHRARFGVSFNSSAVSGEILESSSNFVVGPASSGYAYSINSQSSRATNIAMDGASVYFQNILHGQSGTPFSTVDIDHDQSGAKHCAQLAGAGWWFGACNPPTTNPLGWSYSALPGTTTDSHIKLPGLDMARREFAQGFQRVYMTIDL